VPAQPRNFYNFYDFLENKTMNVRQKLCQVGFLVLLVLCPVVVSAQVTPVSATSSAEFTASADHSTIDPFGRSIVEGYRLDVFVDGTTTIAFTKQLGKPLPVNNIITLVVPEFGTLPPNVIHRATVIAFNADAASPPSAPSNPFGVPGPRQAPAPATGVQAKP